MYSYVILTLDFIHNQITILLFVNNNFLEIGTQINVITQY